MSALKRCLCLPSALLFASGCSLALDFEALTGGEEDGATATSEETCQTDEDCDDGIDCTTDRCNAANECVHDPSNAACPGFEVCRRDQGCVDVGRECLVDGDCDDGIACTRDFCNNDGACRNTPDDDRCEAANRCVTDQTCDPENGCVGGFEVLCEQEDDSCYTNVCNPETGACDLQVPRPGADDDGDGFCDAERYKGGDDCQDNDDAIYPGAPEICNRLDSNCDGLADGIVAAAADEVVSGAALFSPAVAFGDGRYAVAWQEGAENTAAVHVQLLGDGDCIVEPDCESTEATPASEVVNLTALSGDVNGRSPAIAYVGGKFHVVWITDSTPPAVRHTAFGVQSGGRLDLDAETETLSGEGITALSSPSLGRASDRPVAAWAAALEDGTISVQIYSNGALLTGPGAAGDIASLSIDCRAECIVVYDQVTDGDPEVFAVRLAVTDDLQLLDTEPLRLSEAATTAGDASSSPSVTWRDPDTWVATFTDVAVADDGELERESDIRGSFGDGVLTMISDSVGDHGQSSVVFDGNGYGILFVNEIQGASTLQLALFDDAFVRVKNQRTELDTLNGTFAAGPLIRTDDHYAAVWIARPDTGPAHLRFLAFEPCSAAE